jgi:hypothetical protein
MAEDFHRRPGAGLPLTPVPSPGGRGESLWRRCAPRLNMDRVPLDRLRGLVDGFRERRVRVDHPHEVL